MQKITITGRGTPPELKDNLVNMPDVEVVSQKLINRTISPEWIVEIVIATLLQHAVKSTCDILREMFSDRKDVSVIVEDIDIENVTPKH